MDFVGNRITDDYHRGNYQNWLARVHRVTTGNQDGYERQEEETWVM